jgi:putative peptide zinc metalloprotease protein
VTATATAPSRKGKLLATARPEDLAAALAERHGAASDRPALRKDLVIRRLVQIGEVVWVIKNPEVNAYFNFDDADWGLIHLFDGARTLREIHESYQAEFPGEDIPMSLILEHHEMLRDLGLLEQSAAERNLGLLKNSKSARQRAADEKAEGFNIFFLLFHVLDPNEFLNRTVKYVRWLWRPPAVAVGLLASAWTAGVIAVNFTTIWIGTAELYNFLAKPLIDAVQFFFILTCIGCVHEFAHAYVVKIYGGDVHDIGIALLYFTPAFYCDTTDSTLFENKWPSLWVTTAGIYIEAWMCFFATALWVASYPDTLLNELAFKTMLFTGVSTVFFNINPLIKIDGYYGLTSVLEMPELREESFRYLGAWVQHRILRLPVEIPMVSRRKRRIYWIYGSLALMYVGVIMSFIGGLFLNLYDKYVPNFAIPLLLLTLYRLFRKRVRLVTRTARLFYLDKKELLMSPRSRKVVLASAGALALLLLVPWTRRTIATTATLKPFATARLEAPEDAVVAEVFAQEGDRVEAGQPVFRLVSPAAVESGARLLSERARLRGEESRGRQAAEANGVFRSEQRGASVDAAIRSGATREERLLVRSPIAGRVLTPYVQNLAGQSMPGGSLLAEIGDDRKLTAELSVSERLLDDLEPGAPVSALLRGRLAPARGTLARISPATLAQPRTASAGSDPAAPVLLPERFVALAVFENPEGRLLPGMTGRARIYGRRASYASRTWRVLKRWVQSGVW